MREKEQHGGELNQRVWKQFQKALAFNDRINLAETVEVNENFFVGRQWEGVNANGLPTPVFNFLKRVTLHQVASITSDNLAMRCIPLQAAPHDDKLEHPAQIVSEQFRALMEYNRITNIMREVLRNAAVDGDGCTYSWWDDDADMGNGIHGTVRTEVLENNRVFFGNPNDRRVQTQPYILIMRRDFVKAIKEHAEDLECSESVIDNIKPDDDESKSYMESLTEGRCTVVTRLRKDRETGTIWCCEVVQGAVLREEYDLGIRRYPITWLNWDYVQDCYHGQALITGLIPNQVFINKLYAMSMLSLMSTAYPKIIYDKTRIKGWTNQVGAAIGVNGGDMNNAVKIVDPAQISPQIAQFIKMAVEDTQSMTGATTAAMGEGRADNTSAIIALQRAASIPSEITKQNMYQSVEDLGLIYLEFMSEYYGKRPVDVPISMALGEDELGMLQFANVDPSKLVTIDYDFNELKEIPMQIRIDVGASSYWSEVASMQTLDNLLMQKQIDVVDYLERLPEGYITKRQELIEKYRQKQLMAEQAAMGQMAPPPAAEEGEIPDLTVETGERTAIPETAGFGALQRELVNTGRA